MDRWDEEEHNKNNRRNSDNDKRSNEDKGWIPRHKDPPTPTIDHSKIYSVSEASRLHKEKNITVKGVISGIQPMRKMIKGLTKRCMNCNTVFEKPYNKPEFFEFRSC